MKNKKKKGFTLVELLAVIVILAIILIIAVPQILNTINSSRYAAIKSSAELLINQAEKQYMTDQALSANTGSDLDSVVYGGITTLASGATKLCTELTELNPNEYDTCKITVTNEGVVTLNELTGKGKFNGYSCTGTKNNVTCTGGGNSGGSSTNNGTEIFAGLMQVNFNLGEEPINWYPDDYPLSIRNNVEDAFNDQYDYIINHDACYSEYDSLNYATERYNSCIEDESDDCSYEQSEVEDYTTSYASCVERYKNFLPVILKAVVVDGKVAENYAVLKWNNIYYSLRSKIDESDKSEQPIFDANVSALKSVFGEENCELIEDDYWYDYKKTYACRFTTINEWTGDEYETDYASVDESGGVHATNNYFRIYDGEYIRHDA